MHILLRADASPHMGTGHVMRCIALAQWAKKLRIPCTLMGRVQVSWVEKRLAHEGIDYFPLLGEIPKEEDPTILMESLAAAPQNSWVVLDGYHFSLACQKAVRAAGHKLLVIDDYAHLPEYSCDILLNQNIDAHSLKYGGDIGKKCLGLEYTLLRQEFITARTHAQKRSYPSHPQNILLSLGGGNYLKHLQRIAPLFQIKELSHCTLRILGGAVPKESIHNCLIHCPAHVEVLYNVTHMPALLLETDLCISAGGSTCWELCCLNIPFLTVEIADNQHDIVIGLQKQHIAQPLNERTLQAFFHENTYIKTIENMQHCPIDGQSMQRIFQAIQGI